MRNTRDERKASEDSPSVETFSPDFNEAVTRKQLIDSALEHAGWDPIVPFGEGKRPAHAAVEEYPTKSGPADYLLFFEGRPLAVVEGKKVKVAPQNVLSQAERYSEGLEGSPFSFGKHHVPFAYSTNGVTIWFRDLRRPESRSRKIAAFHTPRALKEMLDRDVEAAEAWLHGNPEMHPRLRDYQREAIQSVEATARRGRRRMLVAMATGTGKTLMTVALLYRLLKSGYAKRILFLVDRRALAAQTASEMAAFEAEPGLKFDRIYEVYGQRFKRGDFDENLKFDPKVLPTTYLTNPKPGSSFVYVSTIQRMRINLFGRPEGFPGTGDQDEDSDAEKLDIPIHAFDLIVADECHRGYTSSEDSKWREVLEYFDAVKVGLTATPAAHTKAYFEDIVFNYDYARAVREGWLVDYDPVIIDSGVRMKGLFLKPGEEVQLVNTQTGETSFETLEDEREFETASLERKVTAPDSNRKIVREFLKHARAFEESHGHFPKTIVFASNDIAHTSHADQLVNLLRDECGRGDDFVRKITGNPNVDRPLKRIREFRNRQEPAIVVTVDMLSTGVDIPKCEALLFIRPVKSRILFEQMLGRGTRLCPEINKTHFMVFDAVNVLEYFRNASEFTVEPPSKPSRTTREVIDAIHGNKDRAYNVSVLTKRLQRIAKAISAEGREMFADFVPGGDIAAFAKRLPKALDDNWADTMEILCDTRFQELLDEYPRAEKTFVVAHESEDVVASTYHIRTADGRLLKPDDYLQSFERFVKEHPEQVIGLKLLLERPEEFSTATLAELRKSLAARPERYTDENLRKAYHNELADIISIIRHAARGEPLGTAEERIDRAFTKLRSKRKFSEDQEKWLVLIHNHLVQNLLIERKHFAGIPFSRYGGWKKADRDFDGKLAVVIEQINTAVLA